MEIFKWFFLLCDCFPSLPQVRGHSFKQCMRCVWCQGWGDWMAVAGELTSNMKVKWQAGHNKVSFVPPFQTSQEQSSRKRPSQLLADVPGRMFHWQTRGRRRSLMVPLITSNLHLAVRESFETPVRAIVWNLKHPTQLTLAPWQNILANLLIAYIFSWVELSTLTMTPFLQACNAFLIFQFLQCKWQILFLMNMLKKMFRVHALFKASLHFRQLFLMDFFFFFTNTGNLHHDFLKESQPCEWTNSLSFWLWQIKWWLQMFHEH